MIRLCSRSVDGELRRDFACGTRRTFGTRGTCRTRRTRRT